MSLSKSPKQYTGVRAITPPNLQLATRAPTSADKAYVKGDLWLDTDAATAFMFPGSGSWISLGSGTTGAIVTLTGGSGGAISPVAGDIDLLGTASQITSTGTAGTITFSIPAAFVAPGSIASTTTVTSGTALVATTSVTAGTTVTATLGAITATNGNLVLGTAGNKLSIATGANASLGTSAAMTAGAIVISTTAVSASSKIFVTHNTLGGTPGAVSAPTASIIAGTSFAIASSSATDTSTVNWMIIN